jgi:YVTN family beta-propeller protein
MQLLAPAGIALLAACCSSAAAATPAYRVAAEVAVPGDDGWDYLSADSGSGHLFIAHGSKIQVLNLADLTPAGEVTDIKGAHGVALATDLGHGYISSGRSDSVVEFDVHTLARLREIATSGGNPDAILYDAATHQVFTFNGRGRNASVIDARTDTVVATIPLNAKPEFAVDDLDGRIYVNLEDTNSLAVIDAATHAVVATWKLTGCDEPSGLAIDRAHRRLFSVCSNQKLLVVDSTSGKIVTTLPIGAHVDGVAFDPGTQLAFASGGDGTMTVVHEETPQKFAVSQTVATKTGARTVTLDETTHRVYTVTAKYDSKAGPGNRPQVVPRTFAVLMLDR